MRVLLTTDTLGGVWTFTSELCEQLLARGHEIYLLSFGRGASSSQTRWSEEQRHRYDRRLTTRFSSIPLEWMQNNEGAFEAGQKELLDQIACFVPDLILSNQLCFGRLDTPVPRIVVAHSDVLSWARACKPSALEPSPWLNRYIEIVQAGLLRASAIVAPTAWMGEALAIGFSLPSEVVVIPNGIGVKEPVEPLPQRRFQAITAGRLWDQAKGLDTLQNLRLAMPLLIAGDNSFESPEPNTAWPSGLVNLGPLRQTDLHRYFRESDVYICPSRYEPFGFTPLEAALCGCVPVVRDLPSLREVWAEGALYFTGNDSLTSILQSLGWNDELLTGTRARAYKRALLYTPERMAESYLHLFETVLQQTQSTPHAA